MPNLNGLNWVRQTPKFTHAQVEALKQLHTMSISTQLETLEDHGEWRFDFKPLNSKSLSDILYALATGEYELDTDEYEKYLMDRVDYWHSRDSTVYYEMMRVLDEYRQFQMQAEETS
ncbi:hypothetical protein 010DV004_62 [Bacillus phage 010DV004]|nr:hypothetical protein 010DV004_62 [Bacillus phage 010DV004]QZA69279.1 hypothetical protein 010DV005_62 [Bacillus phage 010DV005]